MTMVKQYIGGKLVEGRGRPLEVYNPATGEIAGTVGSATAAQAEEALLVELDRLPESNRNIAMREYCFQGGGNVPTALAACGMLGMMLLYPFIQKYFVRGVMIGAVKG